MSSDTWRKIGIFTTVLGFIIEIIGEYAEEKERDLEIKDQVQKEVQIVLNNSQKIHSV